VEAPAKVGGLSDVGRKWGYHLTRCSRVTDQLRVRVLNMGTHAINQGVFVDLLNRGEHGPASDCHVVTVTR